jgi:hypothetical protein
MAAVAGFLYCEDRPRHGDYGSATTQPWTIGWVEDDTQIRLNLIARAWVALRSAVKPAGAYCPELVRTWPFSTSLPTGMEVVMQERPGSLPKDGGENLTDQMSNRFSRTNINSRRLLGSTVAIAIA